MIDLSALLGVPSRKEHALDTALAQTASASRTRKIHRDTRAWVPSIRESIVARPGWTFSTEDYTAGEVVTHAQSCLWICGESRLAEALNNGKLVHNLLGATMIGVPYAEFQTRLKAKDRTAVDARQAAKPANFGFPGGMGPAKLVLTQRKQGPDTPHPSGPIWITDDAGVRVRGYRGLRFCILMDGAPRCGENIIHEWGGREKRPIPPTCERCIKCAVRLKDSWLETWPENHEYFSYINDCMENGMLITAEHLRLWPHLAEVYTPGRLAPGEIMQHVSGRVRGDTDYCSAANGLFQGLLADLMKAALRRITRECYDRTCRVDMAHENSNRSEFHGGPSPLFGHRPILSAHDEIIAEHPDSELTEGACRISEIMVEEEMHYCPGVRAACAADPAAMKSWYKGAASLWEQGLLDPASGKRDKGRRATDCRDKLLPYEPKR
jgi:DNA polymerase-1